MTHIAHIVPWKHGHPSFTSHPVIMSILACLIPPASLQSLMLRPGAGLATSGFRGIALHVGLALQVGHHQVNPTFRVSPSPC